MSAFAGPGATPPATGDDEPRARDVIAIGGVPAWDAGSRWETARRADFTLPRIARTEMELRLDPDRWQLRSFEMHEREIPPQLIADLREQAPQALLRDLHRPVRDFHFHHEIVEGSTGLGAWEEAAEEIRVARILPLRADVGSSLHAMRDRQQERRTFLAVPWQPLLDDAEPRRRVQIWADSGG